MIYISIVAIMILVFIIISELISIFKSDKETSMAQNVLATGISLILSNVTTTNDKLMSIVFHMFKIEPIELPTNSITMVLPYVIGIILILLGIFQQKNLRNKVYILNMIGAVRREICDGNNFKLLKLEDYKTKEFIIDFMIYFKNGIIQKEVSDSIVKVLEDESKRFNERSFEFKTCFTGTAPIPYTILLGTYMDTGKIMTYYEYNRSIETYYQLSRKRRSDVLKIHHNLKHEFPQNMNTLSTDIVVTISITKSILESDLIQFNGKDVFKIFVDEPKDNFIQYLDQLFEYKVFIADFLEDMKGKYPNLNTIHLVCSIPSCMSIEIGKIFNANRYRLVRVISYHYLAMANPRYIFGIVVQGNDKGIYIV